MEREELSERLALIEQMIDEGRRDTEYWGWAFVLWGVGHLVAIVWSQLAQDGLAWGVTMTACGIIMGLAAALQGRREHKSTALGRAMGAVWASLGIGMFLAGMLGGISGSFQGTTITLVFFVLMGVACFSSGLILRWPLWTALGLAWWLAAAVAMFASPEVVIWLMAAMALVGEVAFGIFLMVLERREARGAQAPRP